jgi:hypothetical protein
MNVIRWIARTLSVLILAFHIASFLGDRSSVTLTAMDTIKLILWAIILLGMIIAWKWEGIGGLIIIGGFIIQGIINPIIFSAWVMWIAPFTGILFLIYWTQSRKKNKPASKTE